MATTLPNGYTKLTALYHKAYYILNLNNYGFKYNTNMVLEITIKLDEIVGYAANAPFFVTFYSSGYATSIIFANNLKSITIRGSGTGSQSDRKTINFDITDDLTKKVTITIDRANNKFKINSTEYDVDLQSVFSNSRGNDYLFRGDSSNYFKSYLYGFKAYESNVLVFDLIPCAYEPNKSFGFYETVNEKFVSLSSTYWEAYRDSETDLEDEMVQRGEEKLAEHIRFISVDGTIFTNGMKYKYGEDFNLGDYVTVFSKKLNKYFNLQITSISKSISNGVEYFDIGFGEDRLKIVDVN